MDNVVFTALSMPEVWAEMRVLLREELRTFFQEQNGLNQSGIPVDPDPLLTVKQAAEFLDLTPASIYGLVHAGKIPGACKRGKRLYFSKLELVDWIKAGRKLTAPEIDARAEEYARTRKRR